MQGLARLKRQGNPPDQFAGESRDNGNSAQHPPIMRETEPLQDLQTGFLRTTAPPPMSDTLEVGCVACRGAFSFTLAREI